MRKRLISALLSFLLIFPTGLTVSSAAVNTTGACGTVENPAFNLMMLLSDVSLKPSDEVIVTVTVTDILPKNGLVMLHFLLYYDKDKVEPVFKNDHDNMNMNQFLVKAPNLDDWSDGVCKLNEEEGYYSITFFTAQTTGYAKSDYSIIIQIPFRVKSNASGVIEFRIPDEGTYAADEYLKKIIGNGNNAVALINVGNTTITGYVSINGIGVPGQTLTVNTTDIKPSNADYEIIWIKDSEILRINQKSYTVTKDDVGSIIYVIALGTNKYNGEIMSYGIEIVDTIDFAPIAPSLYKKGPNEVVLLPYDGCEYKIDGGQWQDSNVFTGLTTGRTYKFYARYKTPAGSPAAPSSDALTVTLTNTVIGINENVNDPMNYGFFCGLPEETTVKDFAAMIGPGCLILDSEGNTPDANTLVGTGMFIHNGTFAQIVIKGDLDGDGFVDSVDCLLLKRAIIGTKHLEGAYLSAACVTGGTTPDSFDYLKLKRHIIGTDSLYN